MQWASNLFHLDGLLGYCVRQIKQQQNKIEFFLRFQQKRSLEVTFCQEANTGMRVNLRYFTTNLGAGLSYGRVYFFGSTFCDEPNYFPP